MAIDRPLDSTSTPIGTFEGFDFTVEDVTFDGAPRRLGLIDPLTLYPRAPAPGRPALVWERLSLGEHELLIHPGSGFAPIRTCAVVRNGEVTRLELRLIAR